MGKTFSDDFKRFFGRGLAILLPTIVTLWILWQAFSFVFTNVAAPINRGLRIAVIESIEFFPENVQPEWYAVTPEQIANRQQLRRDESRLAISDAMVETILRREKFKNVWNDYWFLEATGLLIAIILIYLAGLLLGNFFGRRVYLRVEALIARVPGFKQVYPHVKQVVDLILGEKKMAFSQAVLVEYPSSGIWTVGFLTGDSLRSIDESAGAKVVSVFIPTSPTPFTGFVVNVREDKVRRLDISVEDTLRFVITAGVLTPNMPAAGASPTPGEPRPVPDAVEPADTESDPNKPASDADRRSA